MSNQPIPEQLFFIRPVKTDPDPTSKRLLREGYSVPMIECDDSAAELFGVYERTELEPGVYVWIADFINRDYAQDYIDRILIPDAVEIRARQAGTK